MSITKEKNLFWTVAGCVKTGMMDFIIIKNLILQNNLYVIPESYQVMFLVEQECQKAENMNLFTASYGKFVILDEFESVQSQTTQNVRIKKLDILLSHLRKQYPYYNIICNMFQPLSEFQRIYSPEKLNINY